MPGDLAVAGQSVLPALGGPSSLHPFRARRLPLALVGGVRADPEQLNDQPNDQLHDQVADPRAGSAGDQVLLDAQARLHVHEFTSAGHRVRGLVGLIDLGGERLDRGPRDLAGILPHEAVDPARVARLTDRLAGSALDAAPLLLLHRGTAGGQQAIGRPALPDLLDEVTAHPPEVEGRDALGAVHRLWSVPPGDLQDRLAACIGLGQMLLADGHHRYAAHLDLTSRTPAAGTGRALAMVTDSIRQAPSLHPIHRVLTGVTAPDVEAALARAGHELATTTFTLQAGLGASPAGELLLVSRHATRRVRLAGDPATDPSGALAGLLETGTGQLTSTGVRYHHDAHSAVHEAQNLDTVALILPSPSLSLAWQAALAGRLLPVKATSFQPKPPPGVLFRSWHDR